MSEQRKRWADDQIKALWDSERLGGPTADPGELEADHLQARDFVKRLAARLREIVPGGHDWGCASVRERMHYGAMKRPCDCATGRLLAEVDPQ